MDIFFRHELRNIMIHLPVEKLKQIGFNWFDIDFHVYKVYLHGD